MNQQLRIYLLFGIAIVAGIGALFVDPIAQNLSYHLFVDQRKVFGLPNFWNVISNAPFIVIGILGLYRKFSVTSKQTIKAYNDPTVLFFIGILLTGLGSGYYHLHPTNQSLVWDRLPMTISFMAFFSIILSWHFDPHIGKIMLWPLIALGLLSVLYWIVTESLGKGDLRFYALVQFLPMLLIPLIMVLFPQKVYYQGYIWAALLLYVLAKVMEHFDIQLYEIGKIISGHSIKHVVAAIASYTIYRAVVTGDRNTG
jgi:Ceramidase